MSSGSRVNMEGVFGSADERQVWTLLPQPRPVTVPVWPVFPFVLAVMLSVARRGSPDVHMWEVYERFAFYVAVAAMAWLAMRVEERIYYSTGRALRLVTCAALGAAGMGLIAIPFGYIAVIGPAIRPLITLFGIWIASSCVGSILMVLLDGALRTLVADFRRRLVLAVLGLVSLAFTLCGVVAVTTVEWLIADRTSAALPRLFGWRLPTLPVDVYQASPGEVTAGAMVSAAALAFPAMLSLCAKLAETVMERIRVLAKAFDAVSEGERSVHVEETGSAELLSLALSFNEMVDKLYLAERIERAFGQYVSNEVVGRIRAQRGQVQLPAELRTASVFFADIRGFTSLSERLAPEMVVNLLNRYLEQVVPVVEEYQGFLNKFIGDAVVVVFNGPINQLDHAERATRCSIALQKRMAELNAQGVFSEVGKLEIGVGVATGPMLCGNIGTKRRLEYTVIGDTVNLASRMTGHARANEAWVSEATAKALPRDLVAIASDPIKFKGKDNAVIPYCVYPASGKETGRA